MPAWCERLADIEKPGDDGLINDILIIGGGIYGCGIAQAAAASGYSVTLIEKNSIASGTSSQSTKLIHGGLRYLEQGNLKLVYAALSEREALLNIAPQLVHREWFYIPVYAGDKRSPWLIACGLLIYWLLSGGRSRFRWLARKSWPEALPGISKDGLRALLAYQDAATDDAALTRAVAASAASFGCQIIEGKALEHAQYDGQQWCVALDDGSEIRARMLINASGPWMDVVCTQIEPVPPKSPVQLVQGTHLLLNRPCSAYIYTESADGRVMFFRPWQGKMLVGTTETVLAGMPDKAQPTAAEVAAILATYNRYFPDSPCTQTDILDTFCGVRVLPSGGEAAFAANRETVILVDDKQSPTYLGIYGGKLTTYRREAEKAMALLAKRMPPKHKADTRRIALKAGK